LPGPASCRPGPPCVRACFLVLEAPCVFACQRMRAGGRTPVLACVRACSPGNERATLRACDRECLCRVRRGRALRSTPAPPSWRQGLRAAAQGHRACLLPKVPLSRAARASVPVGRARGAVLGATHGRSLRQPLRHRGHVGRLARGGPAPLHLPPLFAAPDNGVATHPRARGPHHRATGAARCLLEAW
jgi:hypothetical protein